MSANVIKASGLLFELNAHYLNHLIRIYKLFDGDIELCIVLGEIGHYNCRNLFPDKSTINLDTTNLNNSYTGCNASSISMSSGIPRETVRRKLRKLETMGFIRIDDSKKIIITDAPRESLGEFSKETMNIFLSFLKELKAENII